MNFQGFIESPKGAEQDAEVVVRAGQVLPIHAFRGKLRRELLEQGDRTTRFGLGLNVL